MMRRVNLGFTRTELWRLLELMGRSDHVDNLTLDARLTRKVSKAFEKIEAEKEEKK